MAGVQECLARPTSGKLVLLIATGSDTMEEIVIKNHEQSIKIFNVFHPWSEFNVTVGGIAWGDNDVFHIHVVEESPGSIGFSGINTQLSDNRKQVMIDQSVSVSFMEDSCPVVHKVIAMRSSMVGTEVVGD
ncbi:hypothetical protein Ancab_014983 [Ancistrocladus abbreviatus]